MMVTADTVRLAVPQASARVQSGDLWQLGTHRLLCGDCTRADDIARLMCGEDGRQEAADLLFLDPPYGVGYGEKLRREGRPRLFITHDGMGEVGTYEMMKQALRIAPLRPGGVFYVCSPGGSGETVMRLAVRDAGLQLRQSIIWVKQAFVLSRQDYHWRHEVMLYGWKEGAKHYFIGDRTQDTVWTIPRLMKNNLHPTQKPLSLVERAITNSSRPGEIVFDGFGGSGTTLIACEETERHCRIMEIEPGFCDIVLARFEQSSIQKAVRINQPAMITMSRDSSKETEAAVSFTRRTNDSSRQNNGRSLQNR